VVLRRARNIQEVINSHEGGTTFCFKSKIYRLQEPITPKSHNTFIGEYGAILDGSGWQTSDASQGAFSRGNENADNVTIRNLIIRDMPQKGISSASGDHWTIDHNEISGALVGISIPDYSQVTNNFIHHNDQYGFNRFEGTGFVFKKNEVSHNEICLCYPNDGGASKLVGTTNVSVIGNYIHDNGGNAIWFDTNNTGMLIEGNTVKVNTQYGKAISMEQNTGTAIIRNNKITVGSGGEVAIRLNNSSNVQINNNKVTMAATSGGGAIHVFFDASRTGYDTMNNRVINNTITLRRSATITAGITCAHVTSCSPYWTTKGNVFQGNTYRVPSRSDENWALVSAVDWPSWQAIGFDTEGEIIISP
jgi:hypothetical protein